MRKRCIALAAILLLAIPLQGCWNYKEIETMNVVAGFAIDKGYEGYKYHLTFDIADTSSAGKDKPVETELLESEGDTIMDAMRSAVERSGMRLYFQNCQIVVIGKDVAEESILPIIDFLTRNGEIRNTTELFVSEEKTAKEILEQKPTTMSITSFEIDKMYEQNEKMEPVASYRLLYENYNTLASKGQALTLASLHLRDNMGKKTAMLSGMAVFSGDRLTGFINGEDAKYAMFAMGRVKGGVLNVKTPAGNTIAALEMLGNKTTVIPIVENGTVRFQVHTETVTALEELGQITDVMDKEARNGFEAAVEMQLKESIIRSIRLVQEQLGVDIFGFGSALHRSDPGVWYQLEKDWDDVFRNLQVDVSCRVSFRNSGTKLKPAKVGE